MTEAFKTEILSNCSYPSHKTDTYLFPVHFVSNVWKETVTTFGSSGNNSRSQRSLEK